MENQKPGAQQKSLSLMDISSPFICLGFGLGLAVIAFLIELIIYKGIIFKKSNNDRLRNMQQPVIEAPQVKIHNVATADRKKIENTLFKEETVIMGSVGEEENLYGTDALAPFVGTILIDVLHFLNESIVWNFE